MNVINIKEIINIDTWIEGTTIIKELFISIGCEIKFEQF